MEGPRILILTAIFMEAWHIGQRLGQRASNSEEGIQFPYKHLTIDLRIIGVGAIRLPPPGDPPPAALIMAGLAGALDPALEIGNVIIDESSNWPVHPLPYMRRKIHTATALVGSVGDKSTLWSKTGASAVEMENAPIRQLAGQWGAKYLGVRSISDRADQPIDPAVLKCITPFGAPKAEIVWRTLRRPGLTVAFYRLLRDSGVALKTLATAVESILSC